MGAPEKKIINQTLKDLPENKRLFRINAGQGWQGEIYRPVKRETIVINPGTIVMRNPRVFHGAPDGWPDLAGWETVVITPEMVGQKIAVFTGEEVKAGKMRLSGIQKMFGDLILSMGGRFRVVR